LSISVQHITKYYGPQKALDDVSFEIPGRQVVGFLGPNGAGKSTMMKILTCFLPQTSGSAFVCGLDVEENALEVRKKIGYLPEHNPLYTEMYVREYLQFVGGVHKQPGLKTRINEVIALTGLGDEQHKKIMSLSKGFRQRVGLAQALLHDPEVLILDEPTSGLDPNQLTEIRSLIRETGKEKTVILSTHIMQEVEAMCSRVMIISKGKIVADGPASVLQQGSSTSKAVLVEFDAAVTEKELKSIKGVKEVYSSGTHSWRLITDASVDARPDVFNFAVSKQLTVLSMQVEEQRLEDVFHQLTSDTR